VSYDLLPSVVFVPPFNHHHGHVSAQPLHLARLVNLLNLVGYFLFYTIIFAIIYPFYPKEGKDRNMKANGLTLKTLNDYQKYALSINV
jgi:hypothetical protein